MRINDIAPEAPGPRPRAVVLGTAITGIAVIRSLGRMGVRVVGVDKDVLSAGYFSRYCRSVRSPDPEIDEGGYVRLLMDLGRRAGDRPVLFTTRDRETAIVSRHKAELSEHFRIPVADYDLVEQLVDKRKFYELIRDRDIDYPATFAPESIKDAVAVSGEVPYPCIVKPVDTIPFSRQFGMKCFFANDPDELIRGYTRAATNGHEVIVQEAIPGDEHCLYHLGGYFDQHSEPTGLFLQRKIRNCPELYGIGSYAEGCDDPAIVRAGARFMKEIKYRGIGVVEMKKDPRDGRYKVLEVNARPWTQLWLVTNSGVNLPYLAYCDMIGEPAQKQLEFRAGLKWLCMSDDLRTCASRWRDGRLGLKEYAGSLRGKKVYSVLDPSDPVPFLMSPIQLGNLSAHYLLKRLGRAVHPPGVATRA